MQGMHPPHPFSLRAGPHPDEGLPRTWSGWPLRGCGDGLLLIEAVGGPETAFRSWGFTDISQLRIVQSYFALYNANRILSMRLATPVLAATRGAA